MSMTPYENGFTRGAGSVLHGEDAVLGMLTQRNDIRYVQSKGFLVLNGYVRNRITGDDPDEPAILSPVQIEMGCINDNATLTYTPKTTEIPQRCGDGNIVLQHGGSYKFDVDVKQLDPILVAMITGQTIKTPDVARSGMNVIITETLTIASNVVVTTNTAHTILSVKNLSTGEMYHEAEAAAGNAFTYTTGTKTLTFASLADGVKIEVMYIYTSTTASDGYVIETEGISKSSKFNGYISFLAVTRENNAVARVIVKMDGMVLTSDFSLGGANQDIASVSMSFSIDGEPSYHWVEFA